jgi:hypothetical protein
MKNYIKPMWNIVIVNCITNSCIWNTYVTWQGIALQAVSGTHDSVETCRGVIICEIIIKDTRYMVLKQAFSVISLGSNCPIFFPVFAWMAWISPATNAETCCHVPFGGLYTAILLR